MSTRTNTLLHGAQSTIILVGAIVLAVTHRIPWDTASAIIAGLGGTWSGVAGAVRLLGKREPVLVTQGVTVTPAVSTTPDHASPAAPVTGR